MSSADKNNHLLQDKAAPSQEGEWETPLVQCTPCGEFWHAIACPCVIYGQTTQRLRDPSIEAEKNNADCKEFAFNQIVLGLCFLEVMKQRTDIRTQYGIKGSGFKDFCVSCFCCSCALQQHDAELKKRHARGDMGVVREGYVSEQGMLMAPQQ